MADAVRTMPDRVTGDRPAHIHFEIQEDGSQLSWRCDSPYCVSLRTVHPDHGGSPPIVEGYEFWRGR